MAKNLSEEREALYQMICSLKSEDIQKVVSYVSFLRFVDVYKDKAMADLLKIEMAKDDLPKPALQSSPHDTVDTYVSPLEEFPQDIPVSDDTMPEATKPEITEPSEASAVEPIIEPFIEDVPRYKKLKEELLHKASVEDEPLSEKTDDEQPGQMLEDLPSLQKFADEPLNLKPEEDTPLGESNTNFLSDELYEPLEYEIADELEKPVAANMTPLFSEDDDSFFAPVRSNYFDSKKKPESRVLPEVDEKSLADSPFSEPESPDTSPFEISPLETVSFDDSAPEPDQLEQVSEDPDLEEGPLLQPAPLPREPSEQRLKRVVKSLHLNFADVVFLFNISFPMAQIWFAGFALNAEEEMQLQYLLEIAIRVEKMNIPRFDRIIRHPMPDGDSFLKKLRDREITDESWSTLLETAERAEELRRKFKGATKPFHSMQNAINLYAKPLHCEG